MKKTIVFVLFFLVGIFTISSSQAIRLGDQATLTPSITLEEQYDDNIYLEPNNEDDDFITVITPMLQLDVPFGYKARHLVQIIYKAELGIFADNSKEDYANQDLTANVEISLPKGYIKVSNLLRDTSDRSNTEFTERIDRIENTTDVAVGVDLNKITLELGYSHFFNEYDETNFAKLEYQEDIYSATIFYQLFPKTSLLLEYNHGEIDYDEDSTRNGDYDQFQAGITGQLTGKTTGTIKAGYQDRNYDTAGQPDEELFVAGVGISTQFTESTRVGLNYQRTAVESTYSANNYYQTDRISAELSQRLTSRFVGLFSLTYEKNDYPENVTVGNVSGQRDDDIWTFDVGIQYSLKDWIKARLSYQYKERDSNFDSEDYKRNLVSLSLNFSL